MFHIVTLLLFSNVMFAAVYQFLIQWKWYDIYDTTQRRSWHSTNTVSEFHTEAPQVTATEGLAQGPYVAARAGFEPTSFGQKVLNLPMTHHAQTS